MIEEQLQNKKRGIYKVDFTIEDIRDLVLMNIDDAQNPNNMFNLSRLKIYKHYHSQLEKYFIEHKNKKPTMADKLAYIILLSYPKRRIQEAKSLEEFKLFQDEFSDFKIIQVIDSEYNENDEEHEDRHDCICSYKNLQIIFIVENKYTEIRLQIGSECITKYKIISKKELDKHQEKRKAERMRILERQREQSEGLPPGFYENKRKQENDEKISSGEYRSCLKCEQLINIKRKKDVYLCKKCSKENKKISCKNCNTPVVLDITSTDEYCLPCERKFHNCIDCNIRFIKKNNEERCPTHQTMYDYREIVGKCENCHEDFIRNNKDSWRTFCTDCYRKFPSCQYCYQKMKVLTSNTQRNPNRKYFKCKDSLCSGSKEWFGWLKEYFEQLKGENTT